MTDHDAAQAATDEAIARVEGHADDDWKAAAYDAVVWLAERRPEFTTDAVWAVLARRDPDAATHERRAMGAVMRRAQADKIVQATERYHVSIRVECHGNPKRVWASLIYDDGDR